MNIDTAADVMPMMSVLVNQAPKRMRRMPVPSMVPARRLRKLSRLAPVGISSVELSVPSGLNAAETTNRIGNSAKNSAMSPTMWRQPTCRNQLPLALPRYFAPVVGLGHQLISSSVCARRKPTIDTAATMRKMKIEMAAARP